ncbi:glycosyltransferase [Acinetobacter indicus]|uniref:glycosyltransferase n=1 Tax=Acinetobacter indicus TaxID=756892 RepID=UPI00257730D7|nr:glycosyltransferase [Acinetobacter indicus]MDM1272923.1 glycosyltransferase [Acinetobacter indicus]
MHILILPSWYPKDEKDVNGCFFREQAIHLARRVKKVGVISIHVSSFFEIFKSSNKLEKYNDNGINGIRYHTINYVPILSILEYRKKSALENLFNVYVKDNGIPDLIHAQCSYEAGLWARFLKKKYNINYIITEHSSIYGRNIVAQRNKNKILDAISNASKLITVSRALGMDMNNFFNSTFNFEVVPNSLSDESKINYKKEKNDKFKFINIAHMNKNKNQKIIIQAFSLFLKKGYDAVLYIGGDGVERESLEKLVASLNLNKNVVFLGKLSRNNVYEEINKSHCMILSSNYETFSVIALEALSQGVPVISTKCGGPEDFINKSNGILVEPNNEISLYNAMKQIYEKYDIYDLKKIQEDTINNFNGETVSKKLIKIFKAVV